LNNTDISKNLQQSLSVTNRTLPGTKVWGKI